MMIGPAVVDMDSAVSSHSLFLHPFSKCTASSKFAEQLNIRGSSAHRLFFFVLPCKAALCLHSGSRSFHSHLNILRYEPSRTYRVDCVFVELFPPHELLSEQLHQLAPCNSRTPRRFPERQFDDYLRLYENLTTVGDQADLPICSLNFAPATLDLPTKNDFRHACKRAK